MDPSEVGQAIAVVAVELVLALSRHRGEPNICQALADGIGETAKQLNPSAFREALLEAQALINESDPI